MATTKNTAKSSAKKTTPRASSAKTTTAKAAVKKTTATKPATLKKTTSSAAKTTKSTKTSTKSATINTWDAKSLVAVTHLLIKIFTSDGNVSDREAVFLNKLLELFGVKGINILMAIQGAKALSTASAIKQVSAFGPKLKKMTADMLKTAAKSDGKVTDSEKKTLADIAKKCNLEL